MKSMKLIDLHNGSIEICKEIDDASTFFEKTRIETGIGKYGGGGTPSFILKYEEIPQLMMAFAFAEGRLLNALIVYRSFHTKLIKLLIDFYNEKYNINLTFPENKI